MSIFSVEIGKIFSKNLLTKLDQETQLKFFKSFSEKSFDNIGSGDPTKFFENFGF